MPKRINIINRIYGRLTVLSFSHTDNSGNAVWNCACSCGNKAQASRNLLVTGAIKSCGCLRRELGRRKPKNITGQKFGRLIAIDYVYLKNKGMWRCKCECGKETHATTTWLTKGTKKSCGCLRDELSSQRYETILKPEREKMYHGLTKHPLYGVWNNMKRKCLEPTRKGYKNYGARGISVCERWLDFKNFYADVKDLYEPGLTMDRIDVHGNYEPGNVRWVTWKVQANKVSTRV